MSFFLSSGIHVSSTFYFPVAVKLVKSLKLFELPLCINRASQIKLPYLALNEPSNGGSSTMSDENSLGKLQQGHQSWSKKMSVEVRRRISRGQNVVTPR